MVASLILMASLLLICLHKETLSRAVRMIAAHVFEKEKRKEKKKRKKPKKLSCRLFLVPATLIGDVMVGF